MLAVGRWTIGLEVFSNLVDSIIPSFCDIIWTLTEIIDIIGKMDKLHLKTANVKLILKKVT